MGAYIDAEGPFDGVLAFSQGAALAAMHIVRNTSQRIPRAAAASGPVSRFKCAILISCGSVYDLNLLYEHGEMRALTSDQDGQLIKIPTVHVWGESDYLRNQSRGVSELCQADLRAVFIHAGGHEVPRSDEQGALAGMRKVVKRGIVTTDLIHQEAAKVNIH